MKPIIISVVTWNRKKELEKTLNSIFENTKVPYKILLTDNGSTDGTYEYLKDLEFNENKNKTFRLECIYLRENMGLAKAKNIHWYKCKGHDVFNSYDDIELLTNGWLGKLKEISDNNSNGLVGLYDPIFIPNKDYNIEREPIPYREVNGACFIPRKCVDKLGFWSEEYGLVGHDDVDYSSRAVLAGFQTFYTRQIKWNHLIPFHHHGSLVNAKKWANNLKKYRNKEKSLSL